MAYRDYIGKDIDVQFDKDICIHAAECVNGLPSVFDVKKKPWISPDNANASEVAQVIHKCPSGALKYIRKDGGKNEVPDTLTTVKRSDSKKLYVRGDLEIYTGDDLVQINRAVLCGCGATNNQPFCDNSDECV